MSEPTTTETPIEDVTAAVMSSVSQVPPPSSSASFPNSALFATNPAIVAMAQNTFPAASIKSAPAPQPDPRDATITDLLTIAMVALDVSLGYHRIVQQHAFGKRLSLDPACDQRLSQHLEANLGTLIEQYQAIAAQYPHSDTWLQ